MARAVAALAFIEREAASQRVKVVVNSTPIAFLRPSLLHIAPLKLRKRVCDWLMSRVFS